MRLRCSGAMPEPESETSGFDVAVDQRGDAQAAAAGHGFLGVQQQIEKDLLQLAGVAVDGGQLLGQIEIDDRSARS